MCRLQVGGVDGCWSNHFRCCDTFLFAPPLAIDKHGVINTFSTARGDCTGLLIIAIDLAYLFAMEHLTNHGEDFSFKFCSTRAQVPLHDVDIGVHAKNPVQKGVVFHASMVHRTGTLTALPFFIFLLRHIGELLHDLFFIPALFRQFFENLEGFIIGMHITKHIH